MYRGNRDTFIKLLLIVIAEIVAIGITEFISNNIVPIRQTTISYIVSGAILAIFIVNAYEKVVERKKNNVIQEVKELTNITLLRFHHIQDKNNRN